MTHSRSIVHRLAGAPALADCQASGFPMGGEGLAVDLADTLVTISQPATDLLPDEAASDRFWRLHGALLPPGWTAPSVARTRRVRAIVRELLDAAERGDPFDPASIEALNGVAALARPCVALELREDGVRRVERWLADDPSEYALAAVARDAIDVLATSDGVRRCASPTCSMLFVTGDARRRWCTPNICANRDRAARHYRRRRAAGNVPSA